MLQQIENTTEDIKNALSKIDSLFGPFEVTNLENSETVIRAQLDVDLLELSVAVKDDQLLESIEEIIKKEKEFFTKSLFQFAKKIDPITFKEIEDIEKPENLVLLDAKELEQYEMAKEHLKAARPIPEVQMIYTQGSESSLVVKFNVGANKMSPFTMSAGPEIKLLDYLKVLFFTI